MELNLKMRAYMYSKELKRFSVFLFSYKYITNHSQLSKNYCLFSQNYRVNTYLSYISTVVKRHHVQCNL